MKSVRKYYSIIVISALFIFSGYQTTRAQNALSPQDQKIVTDFELRAKDYSKLRERLESELPQLPKDATPEQIDAHKTAFLKSVQSARRGAKRGALFTPAAQNLIRRIIKNEFPGEERAELRKTVLEGDTKGVPVRVNVAYPASKELVEMSPALLLNLPQLPKQLRYRFVGRSLLLVDRENGLIVDYMTNALP